MRKNPHSHPHPPGLSRLHAWSRPVLLAAALTSGFAARADYATTILADNPLGYWRLGETPVIPSNVLTNRGTLGTVANGNGYSLTHGQPGALAGSADTAINFTGGAAIMGSPASFNFTGTASFTLEAWVKLTAPVTGVARVIGNGISGQGYAFGFQSANVLRITGLGVADVASDAAPANFPLDTWIHLAVVRSNTVVRFYTNGVQFGANKALANVITTARPLTLGRLGTYIEPLNGLIDEAAVYDRVLSAAEIAANYAAGTTDGADYPATVLALNPIGYWRLNEAQPPAYPTAANAGTVGAGGTGNVIGAPGSVVGGQVGALTGDANTAMSFNGWDAKVQVPFNAGLNPDGAWSISCWARLDGWTNAAQSVLTSRNDSGTGQRGYIFYANNVSSTPQWQFWNGVGTNWHNLAGPNATIGQWAHLVGTYDPVTRTKAFYVDGQRVGFAANVVSVPNEARPLHIGAGSTELNYGSLFFNGLVDEVAVFPGTLSQARVAAQYEAAQGFAPPQLAPPVAVLNPPGSQTIHSAQFVRLAAGFSGSIPITFQWYKVSADFTTTNLLTGATSEVFDIASTTVADTGYYVCVALNSLGEAQSAPAYLDVLPPAPPAAVEPLAATRSVYAGATVTLEVIYGGTPPLAYQWLSNGIPVAGATNAGVTLTNVTPAGSSATWSVQVTNVFGSDQQSVVLNIQTPAASTYAAALVGMNPMSWWRLGDDSGSIAHDSWGGRNGRYENSFPNSTPGALLDDDDGALNVFGSSSRMIVTNGADFNFFGTNAFTLVTWARPDVFSGVQRLMSNRSSTPNGGYGFGFLNNNQIRLTGFGVADINASVASFNLGEWYHVAAVRYNNRMDLYINGTLRTSGTLANVVATTNAAVRVASPFQLGGNPTLTEWFSGAIDEAAVFNRPLTSNEIAQLYSARFGALLPPSLTRQPEPNLLYAGGTANFIAEATGSQPLGYLWRSNGVPIAGATNASYAIPAVTLAMSGGNYSVLVTNAAGSVTSMDASLTVLPAYGYQAAVGADGPVAHWRLGEAFGPTVFDTFGGYNGYDTNGVVFGVPGALGTDTNTAIQLDGTAAHVQVPHAVALNPAIVSVECWARVTGGAGNYRAAVSSRDYQAGYIIYAGNNNDWQFWTRTPGGSWANQGGLPVVEGEWTHLVGTHDGTNKNFYINGVLVSSLADTNYSPNLLRPLRLGAGNNEDDPAAGSIYPFAGDLDEVAIYNRVLTPAQVALHYGLGKYGTTTPPFFVQEPVSQALLVGGDATVTALAGGSPTLTYQWHKNGQPIAGATDPALTLPGTTYSDSGTYYVVAENSLGTTNSASVTLSVMPPPLFANLTNDLVLHLEFENSVVDSSGRGNHGTVVGAPAYVGGAIGPSALSYSTDVGAGSYNYVTLGTPLDLSFGATTDFSVAYWVRMTGAPGDLPFLCTAVGSYGLVGLTFAPGYNTGTWSYYVAGTTGTGIGTGYATAPINDGTWHSLVHTFDRDGNAVTYFDGVQVDTRSITALGDLDNFQPMNVGQDPSGTYAENGAAEIDDIGIWRRALTPYEAASIGVVGRNYGRSFNSYGPVQLLIQETGGMVEVIWQAGTLEENTDLGNPNGWTPVSGASAPYYQVTPGGPQKFYRVRL
jgi:hypothetical protein